jgi:hypothetical protein
LLGGLTWIYTQYDARQKQLAEINKAHQDEDERLLNSFLLPIQLKLKLALSIFQQLKNENYLVKGYGILESYVLLSREGKEHQAHGRKSPRADAEKLALPFGLITELVQTDAVITDLLERYDPSHLTPAFKTESDNFLEHANTYMIRFKALPSIIKTGAPFPRTGAAFPSWKPFPEKFPSALEKEIAARQARITNSGETPPPQNQEFRNTQ